MALEKFHYKVGTKTITVTKLKNLPIGVSRKLRNASDADQTFGMIEAAADEKNLALVDDLTQEQYAEFQKAWAVDSGIDLGESSAS